MQIKSANYWPSHFQNTFSFVFEVFKFNAFLRLPSLTSYDIHPLGIFITANDQLSRDDALKEIKAISYLIPETLCLPLNLSKIHNNRGQVVEEQPFLLLPSLLINSDVPWPLNYHPNFPGPFFVADLCHFG